MYSHNKRTQKLIAKHETSIEDLITVAPQFEKAKGLIKYRGSGKSQNGGGWRRKFSKRRWDRPPSFLRYITFKFCIYSIIRC